MPKQDFFDIERVCSSDTLPRSFSRTDIPYCTSAALKTVYCKDFSREVCRYLASDRKACKNDSIIIEDKSFSFENRRIHSRYGYICTDDYEGSLFEQGHHGLKGKIYNDNIFFTEDCAVSTFVVSEKNQNALLTFGGIKPDLIFLNGKEAEEGEISLTEGKNHLCFCFTYDKELIPDYRNNGHIKRTSVHITKKCPEKQTYPLSTQSFANPDYFKLSEEEADNDLFCFRFRGVPSLTSCKISLFGTLLSIYNNGQQMTIKSEDKGNFGAKTYTAESSELYPDASEIIFFVKAENGYEYGDLIPEPVRLTSIKGRMMTGDLTKTGALKNYSGKFCYEKNVDISKLYPDEHFILETEDIGATATVEINGRTAAVFTYRPFSADVTEFIRNGENQIKITVSDTLCNHYSTIPSKYSNFPKDSASGLLTPVHIRVVEYIKGDIEI